MVQNNAPGIEHTIKICTAWRDRLHHREEEEVLQPRDIPSRYSPINHKTVHTITLYSIYSARLKNYIFMCVCASLCVYVCMYPRDYQSCFRLLHHSIMHTQHTVCTYLQVHVRTHTHTHKQITVIRCVERCTKGREVKANG